MLEAGQQFRQTSDTASDRETNRISDTPHNCCKNGFRKKIGEAQRKDRQGRNGAGGAVILFLRRLHAAEELFTRKLLLSGVRTGLLREVLIFNRVSHFIA
ncbi:hypothetical protein HFO60_06815 [Rhizobium leguminosarum]|uniref:hypothetical protein n=1 Tax=Rhizobium leguminosarum TaxID=384 RepID=UPI001C937B78|nr:hypothetical protein [Rhizobium leguminosarum]MBY5539754.1 hypothetical protein [Rhizobium leguminosarum]